MPARLPCACYEVWQAKRYASTNARDVKAIGNAVFHIFSTPRLSDHAA